MKHGSQARLAEIRQGRTRSPNRGRAEIWDSKGRESSRGQTWVLSMGRQRSGRGGWGRAVMGKSPNQGRVEAGRCQTG
jgi:hypothetical protein